MAAPVRWWHGRECRTIGASSSGQHGQVRRPPVLDLSRRGAVRWLTGRSRGDAVRRCANGTSGSAWRRRGGEALAVSWLWEDKGGVGHLLDMVWSDVELAVDDHNRAALPGHRHADSGILQSMPKPASTCPSSLLAPNGKPLRHWMQHNKVNNFHVVSFC